MIQQQNEKLPQQSQNFLLEKEIKKVMVKKTKQNHNGSLDGNGDILYFVPDKGLESQKWTSAQLKNGLC